MAGTLTITYESTVTYRTTITVQNAPDEATAYEAAGFFASDTEDSYQRYQGMLVDVDAEIVDSETEELDEQEWEEDEDETATAEDDKAIAEAEADLAEGRTESLAEFLNDETIPAARPAPKPKRRA